MRGGCAGFSVWSFTDSVYTYKCVSVDSVLYRDLSWDKQVVVCVGGSLPAANVCLGGLVAHREGANLILIFGWHQYLSIVIAGLCSHIPVEPQL